jgi:hypothetical protein
MATVRFSDEMRTSILRNARSLYDEQVGTAKDDFPKERWGNEVYNLMFKDTMAQMNALPDGYLKASDNLGITGFSGGDRSDDVEIRFAYSPARRVPENFREAKGLGIVKASTYGMHRLDATDPRWDTFKAEYLAYTTALAKVYAERDVFIKGVNEVINAYSTLAPALKAWPALWDLVPEQYRTRHKTIVERKTADPKIEADVDLNRMTAAVTLSKLTR